MTAHVKRIAVTDFVVNVTDDSCCVFPLYDLWSCYFMLLSFIIGICIGIDIMYRIPYTIWYRSIQYCVRNQNSPIRFEIHMYIIEGLASETNVQLILLLHVKSDLCRDHKGHQGLQEKEEIEDHLYDDVILNDVIHHVMHYRDPQVLQVLQVPRETEEKKVPMVFKVPVVLQANLDKLEMMVRQDLQEKQVLQLKEIPVNKDRPVLEVLLALRLPLNGF